jgi:hypothetical protein
MSLARAWTRQLYGASGAAVLVPGTVLIALVLLALAGGFGRLGSLGQAVAGPSVPAGPPLIGTVSHASTNAIAGPPVIAATAGAVAAPSTTAVTPTGAVVAPIAGGSATTGIGIGTGGAVGHSGRGSGSGSGGSIQSRGHGGSGRPGSGSGTGGSGGHPTLWDGVTKLGTSVTNKLPAPVSALGGQVLQSVGSTLDKILPVPGGNTGGGQAAAAPKSLLSALNHL